MAKPAPPLPSSLQAAWAQLREEFRSEYRGGNQSRFLPQMPGVDTQGSGADYHIGQETNFWRLLERARYYDREDGFIGQGLDRLTSNVVQLGYTLDVQTPDKDLNEDLKARWNDWAADPKQVDAQGQVDWCELEALAFRHHIADHDVLLLPLKSGQLDLCESHRLRTPMGRKDCVHGVELSASRKPLAYHVTADDIEPLRRISRKTEFTRYPADQVFHYARRRRKSQTRPVTALAPICETVGMNGDLLFTTLVKAQVAACFAIFEEQEYDPTNPTAGSAPIKTGAATTITHGDGTTSTQQGLSPGMRVKGAPGVKLNGFSPNIPNPEFFPFSTLLLTVIAINLGLPVQVLLLDATKTNFSGWRGALDQARTGFRTLQERQIGAMHRRVYRWKVQQWIHHDALLASAYERHGNEIFAHEWKPCGWSYVQPVDDANGDILGLGNALFSHSRTFSRRGIDWDDEAPRIVKDRELLIREGLAAVARIKTDYPDADVTWRDLAPLPTPTGVNISGPYADPAHTDPASDTPSKEPARAES